MIEQSFDYLDSPEGTVVFIIICLVILFLSFYPYKLS